MAKTARRSVASDPSSSSSSPSSSQQHKKQSTHAYNALYYAPVAVVSATDRSLSPAGVVVAASDAVTASTTTTTYRPLQPPYHSAAVVVDPLRSASGTATAATNSGGSGHHSTATTGGTAPSAARRLVSANAIEAAAEQQHSSHHHNGNSRQFATSTHTSHRPVAAPTPTALPPTFNTSRIHDRVAAERERVRADFYATYDVMTGVRIAATLGGFFGLMVFLVVYKSRGESQETIKALKDPKIAAVAAAVMQEEEDRELQEAMEATGMSIYPDEYDHIGYGRQRMMSVGNISAPPVFNRGYRFSSIGGGYSSLLSPTRRRFSYSESGRNSVSASSRVLSAYPMGGSFGIDDYFAESDDGDEADDEFDQMTAGTSRLHDTSDRTPTLLLSVPQAGGVESRRSSNITCCSTESSYLERRCSAVTLGLQPLPSVATPKPSRRPSAQHHQPSLPQPPSLSVEAGAWPDNDSHHPGIQVIQPTPRTSPSTSERNSRERQAPTTPAAHPPPPFPLLAHSQLRSKSLSLDHQPQSLDSITTYTTSSSDEKLVSTAALDERSSIMQTTTTTTTTTAPDLMPRSGDASRRSRPFFGADRTETTTFSCAPPSQRQTSTTTTTSTSSVSMSVASNNQHHQPATTASAALRRAPLASISSFKISSVDYQDSDLKSLGSDSVFAESYYADTDDELEPFSTDSDELTASDEQQPHRRQVPPAHQRSPAPRARDPSRSSRSAATATATSTAAINTNTAAPTTCSTVNEFPKSPSVRSRRILQRSSTIYPSSESLPKPQRHTQRSCTIETMVTIEPRTTVAAAPVHQQSTPPSTRSLPAATRPATASSARSAGLVVAVAAATTATPTTSSSNTIKRSAPSQSVGPKHSCSSTSSTSCTQSHNRNQSLAQSVQVAAGNAAANSGGLPHVDLEMPTMSVPFLGAGSAATAATETAIAVGDGGPHPQIDPSLPPGATRKWSRETLF